jgi:PIN domain nuclease of toxin-antitoxin system
MNILLDTHAFIWFLNGDNLLNETAKGAIENTENKCLISMASIWELAIKFSLGKLQLAGDFSEIGSFLHQNEIDILPITFEHIQQLLALPFHHRDPFDRIIIAQAISEKLSVITKDVLFDDYGIATIWK